MEILYGIGAALIALFYGLFKYEQDKKVEAESKVETSKIEAKDEVLKFQEGQLDAKIEEEKNKDKNPENLTDDQIKDYWKKHD